METESSEETFGVASAGPASKETLLKDASLVREETDSLGRLQMDVVDEDEVQLLLFLTVSLVRVEKELLFTRLLATGVGVVARLGKPLLKLV